MKVKEIVHHDDGGDTLTIENVYDNMLIKIDGRSNTGVWTIPARELLNDERKTDWIEYHDDKVVS